MGELLLIVQLAGERVAIPAADVDSVVEIEGITPVPRSPAHVAGLAALRSRVLTVIDCAVSLGLGASPREGAREAIVIELDGHAYAFLVDTVEDVLEQPAQIQPLRNALGGGWRYVARGTVEAGDNLLLLVDPHALLAGRTAAAA